jgi:hypothetical protein
MSMSINTTAVGFAFLFVFAFAFLFAFAFAFVFAFLFAFAEGAVRVVDVAEAEVAAITSEAIVAVVDVVEAEVSATTGVMPDVSVAMPAAASKLSKNSRPSAMLPATSNRLSEAKSRAKPSRNRRWSSTKNIFMRSLINFAKVTNLPVPFRNRLINAP